MERREKILAGGLGGAVLLWGVLGFYDNNISAPLKEKDDQLTQAQKDSQESLKEWKGLVKSQKLVRDAVNDSLPPDGQDAQRVYLKWVQELAELSGWKEITPNKNLDARAQLGKIGVRVPVTLTAKARLRQVAQFLWHFERADLLQRVSALHLTSPAADGDPELTVVITLEGVSLSSSPPRKRLYPETEITSPVDVQGTQIMVADGAGFPTQLPFRVRLGTEFATVTAIDGKAWTLTRGVDETTAAAYPGSTSVEYAPFRNDEPGAEAGLSQYAQLVEKPGFIKPAPIIEYTPKLASASIPVLTRGEPWNAELKIDGWNPRWPAPVFELKAAPAGLKVTPTGKLEWDVPADSKPGEYPVQVLVRAGDVVKVESESKITLREKNLPPKFESVARWNAFVGRPFTLSLKAQDDDPAARLTFALAGQVPEGMKIDPRTGTLTWTPAETMEAAPVAFQVTATDSGTPPLSSTLEISGQLDDDHAQYTFVIGFLDKGDSRLALLNDRLSNTTTQVHVGDKFKSSEMDLVIDSIDSDGIALRQGANRMRVEIGQHLREAKPLPPDPKTPPPPPATEQLEKSPDAARD